MTHFSYDFWHPIKRYSLPDQYKEISGLSALEGKNTLAFVQDEAVQIHLFDLNSGMVTEHAKHDDGDCEDIVIAGETAYLLKAGKQPAIYNVTHFNSEDAQFERHDLDLHKEQDPEGLCHDIPRNRLLIACKGAPRKKDRTRGIYAFNLQSMQMDSLPLFAIDSRDFLNRREDTFNPSGLAIHPQSELLYIIGSKGEELSGDGSTWNFNHRPHGGLRIAFLKTELLPNLSSLDLHSRDNWVAHAETETTVTKHLILFGQSMNHP